jgi:hypothetical protein
MEDFEKKVYCKQIDDLQAENKRLRKDNINYLDTLRAIAVNGLGLPDPLTHKGDEMPVEWAEIGLFSERVAEMSTKIKRMEAVVEAAKDWANKPHDRFGHLTDTESNLAKAVMRLDALKKEEG